MSLEEELEKLRAIMGAPPFVEGPLDRLGRFLRELLSSLFGVTSPQGEGNWLAVLIGALIVAAVAFFILRALRNTLARGARAPAPPPEAAPMTSAQALASAQSFALAGDYRTAVRELFLAALIALDEQGVMRYDRSLTNRETLQALARTDGALAAELGPVVDVFDRTWYGFAPIDAAAFEGYRARVEALRRDNMSRRDGTPRASGEQEAR